MPVIEVTRGAKTNRRVEGLDHPLCGPVHGACRTAAHALGKHRLGDRPATRAELAMQYEDAIQLVHPAGSFIVDLPVTKPSRKRLACVGETSSVVGRLTRLTGISRPLRPPVIDSPIRPSKNLKENKNLSIYEDKFNNSWLHKELYEARNVKPSFSWGLILGIIFTGIDQILFRGKLPFTLKHKHADHETLKPANEMPKIDYPKYDNVITFDKTSSVYLTGTNHAENQPVHLRLKDPDLPISYTLKKFNEPAQLYCPAGVYEVQRENDINKFVINSQNCIHCKTCDIKEPSQNITWVTPEGSGGPRYGNM